MASTYYNEIITEHNINPIYKRKMENPDLTLEGINPSCGDEITLNFKVEDGIITEGAYEGDGCAISQASCDMMLDLIVGKPKTEALRLAEIFIRMITGKVTDEELEELEEASILIDISHMPSRVKCAVLGWHTMEEMLKE